MNKNIITEKNIKRKSNSDNFHLIFKNGVSPPKT